MDGEEKKIKAVGSSRKQREIPDECGPHDGPGVEGAQRGLSHERMSGTCTYYSISDREERGKAENQIKGVNFHSRSFIKQCCSHH